MDQEKRTGASQRCMEIEKEFQIPGVGELFFDIEQEFPGELYSLKKLYGKFSGFCKPKMEEEEKLAMLGKAAMELTSQEAPKWENIAGWILAFQFHLQLKKEEEKRKIGDFADKIRYLTEQGLYGVYIQEAYTPEEIRQAASFIVPERDRLLNYSGLDLLLKRYVISSHSHVPLESPQEMFLGIALHLAMKEDHKIRLAWVKDFYDMLSRLEVTMATPTLSNARKPFHQLSSCFIDTVPDSLKGIFRSVDNFAMVSKYGGGMGMYFGKVRAAGSMIRGFEGAAGGDPVAAYCK
jgi:ribonucleoside-diphosphate reductase alpha chain